MKVYTIGMEKQDESMQVDWRDYLMPALGLVIVLFIVIGAFLVIRNVVTRNASQESTDVQITEGEEEVFLPITDSVPSSTVNLTETKTDVTPTPTSLAATPVKGGETPTSLPKTGFPGIVIAGLSSLLLGVGIKLRKHGKH